MARLILIGLAIAMGVILAGPGHSQTNPFNPDLNWCNVQGSLAMRGPARWQCLTPGTPGQALLTGGPGTIPYWNTTPGTGTVTSVQASGGTTGLSFSGGPITGTGTLTLSGNLVNTNVAGTGISVSGATGNVTIGNTGVLSNVAGTGIAVSSGTGNVTIRTTVPTVPNNSALSALSTANYSTVFRSGYAASGDAPAIAYTASGSACSLNAGAGDGGLEVPSADGKCWIGGIQQPADVRIWGAVSGAADNTTELQNALNSGLKSFFVPNGVFQYSSLTVPDGVGIACASKLSAILQTISATADGIILGAASGVDNCGMLSSVTRTAGAFIKSSSNAAYVKNVYMRGYYGGIYFTQTFPTLIVQPLVQNVRAAEPAVTTGAYFLFAENYSNITINDVVVTGFYGATQPAYGIRLINGDTAIINNSNITGHGIAFYANPQPNTGMFATYVTNSLFDSGGTTATGYKSESCLLRPDGNGKISTISFSNSWCGLSAEADGMLINGDAGTIEDVTLTGMQFPGNGGNGLHIAGNVLNWRAIGGSSTGNDLNGIYLSGVSTHGIISGMSMSATAERGPNALYCISLGNVASDYVSVNNNDVSGCTSGAIANGSTGTHNRIVDNIGYNPVGQLGISVGASPFSYTAGASPEVIYITGGTISSVTIGGNTVANATSAAITLSPNQTMVTTYSVLPTMIKSIQ